MAAPKEDAIKRPETSRYFDRAPCGHRPDRDQLLTGPLFGGVLVGRASLGLCRIYQLESYLRETEDLLECERIETRRRMKRNANSTGTNDVELQPQGRRIIR